MSSIIGCGLVTLDSISILICWVYVFLLRSFASCGSRSGGTLFPHGLAYGDMEIWIRRHILYSSRIQHAPECGVAFDLVLQSLLPFFRCEGDLSSCFKLAASRWTGLSGSPRVPIAPGSMGRQSSFARHVLVLIFHIRYQHSVWLNLVTLLRWRWS